MESTADNRRPPTVFLHVGAPKTGTTFLQELMWARRDDLLTEDGVVLPGRRHEHFHATLDVRQVPLDTHPPSAAGSWRRLAEQSKRSRGTVVISHELFAGASAEQARRAVESLRPAEVHVVYTARDLSRQLPAEWQEHVKHRRQERLSEFVDEVVSRGPGAQWFWLVQDAADVLRRWASDLPPDRVHVVTVPPAGSDPRLLWRRFSSVVGIDADRYDLTDARSNDSLGPAEAELLRRVNRALGDRLPFPGPYPRFGKELLAHQLLAGRPGKVKLGLRHELWPWLRERSQEIIDELDKSGYDVVGDLDELLPAEPEPTSVHPDDVGEDAVADVATETAATLLSRLHDATVRADAATRELARRRDDPVACMLIDMSERHASVMLARSGYRRVRGATRRLRGRLRI